MKVDICMSGYLIDGHVCILQVGISEGMEVDIPQEGMSTSGLSSPDHPCTRHPCLEDLQFLSAIATSPG